VFGRFVSLFYFGKWRSKQKHGTSREKSVFFARHPFARILSLPLLLMLAFTGLSLPLFFVCFVTCRVIEAYVNLIPKQLHSNNQRSRHSSLFITPP
jgi:hypothetical protein